MEHRCGHRRAIEVPVTLRTRGGVLGKGVLCDISASGARFTTVLPLNLHSIIYVQFLVRSPSGSRRRETLEAEVVRHTSTGAAVEWVEFAPEAARALYMPVVPALPRLPSSRARTRR